MSSLLQLTIFIFFFHKAFPALGVLQMVAMNSLLALFTVFEIEPDFTTLDMIG